MTISRRGLFNLLGAAIAVACLPANALATDQVLERISSDRGFLVHGKYVIQWGTVSHEGDAVYAVLPAKMLSVQVSEGHIERVRKGGFDASVAGALWLAIGLLNPEAGVLSPLCRGV